MLRLLTVAFPFMAAWAAEDISLDSRPGTRLAWRKNISVPFAGYAFLPEELPLGTLLVTAFDGTPLIPIINPQGSGMYIGDATSPEPPTILPGTKSDCDGNGIDWPNDLTIAPSGMFGLDTQLAVVGAGFLVPTHTTGGVWVLEPSANPQFLAEPVKITADIADYFYHLAEYVDINGDGNLDILTARGTSGILGTLIWLENPGPATALSGEPWVEHQLVDGPDFLFSMEPGSVSTGAFAIAAAEYYGEEVAYYWYEGGVTQKRVIDDDSGPGFSCSWVDLNQDGTLDLLATNHLNLGGSVFAYTFSGPLRNASTVVTKYVLATGFNAIDDTQGSAAPGVAKAFCPNRQEHATANDTTAVACETKPLIFLSNDNGNDIFMLAPMSEDASDFAYATQRLADVGADVGGIAIGDVDGNGWLDIFVPAYDNGEIVHYEVQVE